MRAPASTRPSRGTSQRLDSSCRSLRPAGKRSPPRSAGHPSSDAGGGVAEPPRRGSASRARSDATAHLVRLAATRPAQIALFGALLAVSLAFKVRGLGSAFWIDEGLSVGIASHPLSEIPGLLRQDGSPPLYYMLLHVWIGWFGSVEVATQSLSAIFGLLCVPAAFWAGNVTMGRRVAWAAAALAAINPFLTLHSYETRMYALLVLLGILTTTTFVLAYGHRRRAWLPALRLLLLAKVFNPHSSPFLRMA